MVSDVLFPEPVKERTTYLGRDEPAVHWYSECMLPEAMEGRRVLNAWYAAFPDPDGAVRARLRSENDVKHQQSLDELYMHHLLAAAVEDVRYEEGGVGPDFRLYEQGGLVGCVEVASLFMRQDWEDEARAHGSLAARINRLLLPTAGWFVDLDVVRMEREPSARRLAMFVEQRLDQLPPPGPEARALVGEGVGIDCYPTVTYTAEGVEILVRLMPMKPGAPSMSDSDASIVGMGPIIGGMVNSGLRLRDRVARKAGGRYEIGEAPFAVAVGLHDTFCSDDQIMSGLYGGEAVGVATGQMVRRQDGLFGDGSDHTRISAVATMPSVQPWRAQASILTVWDHPAPRVLWPDRLLKFDRRLAFHAGGGAAFWRESDPEAP